MCASGFVSKRSCRTVGATPTIKPVPTKIGNIVGEMVVGRYVVEKEIGEGGMGKIYRVRHRRLDKHFALKLIRTAFPL